MSKASGVYVITCKANGAQYVGQSANIAIRWATHQRQMMAGDHPNSRLQYHADTYGIGSLEYSVLQACDRSDLELCEAVHMARLKPSLNVNRPKPRFVKMAEMIAGEPFYLKLASETSVVKRCENCSDPVRDPTNRFCIHCARAQIRKMAREGYLVRKYHVSSVPRGDAFIAKAGAGSWDNAVRAIEDG